jgi:hypothetical protein
MEEKWSNSRSLLARAQESLAGGVSSPFRAKFPIPLYFKNGYGYRLQDVDGNECVDYALGWGPRIPGRSSRRSSQRGGVPNQNAQFSSAPWQSPITYHNRHEALGVTTNFQF